jgi:hypothetical protein
MANSWFQIATALYFAAWGGTAPPQLSRPPVITLPQWSETPTATVEAAVREHGIPAGRFTLRCDVSASAWVSGCVATRAEPASIEDHPWTATRIGYAVNDGRITPMTFDGIGLWSRVSFAVGIERQGGDVTVTIEQPVCVRCLIQEGDEEANTFVQAVRVEDFPPEAVRQGEADGMVLMRCRGDVTGHLSECSIWHEAPVGSGFGREVLKTVEDGRLTNPELRSGLVAFIAYFERPETRSTEP